MNQGTQEVANVENVAEIKNVDTPAEQPVANTKVYKTKQEVVERLKQIAQSDDNPDKD